MIGRVRRATVVAIALLLVSVNLRLYSPAPIPAGPDRIVDHLRFVDGAIDDGLAERMQRSFPEGYFFTHALYGLTWVELGLQPQTDETTATEALTEARIALAALDTPAGRAPFSAELEPPYGGFYLGWTNYLRAGVVALQVKALGAEPDPTELAALTADCDGIIAALDRTDSPFLTSYPGQTWPVDTYPAMVSVQACAEFVDADYRRSVERWLDDVDREVDPTHGLVGHRTEPFREHPRATSQTMILRFLAELDPERAAAAYDRFRTGFVTSRLGLPAVREHPNGIDADGDVDSGPLITGVSASATVVAVGAAQVNGDHDLARVLRREGQAFGFPVMLPGGRRYAGGVLPIGDLFVVWTASSHLWFQPDAEPIGRGPSWTWRLPTHIISLAAGLGLWAVLWPGTRRRTRQGFARARRRGPE